MLCCGTSLNSLDSSSTEKGMLYFYDIQAIQSSSNNIDDNSNNNSNRSSSNDNKRPNSKSVNNSNQEMTSPFLGIALSTGCSAVCVKWQPKTNQIFCR